MPPRSAGVLAFRRRQGTIEVLLIHPGGPFWRNKDIGAWSIPKGEYDSRESAEAVARREFCEEIGIELTGTIFPLAEVRQRGGKVVTAFAVEMDVDARTTHSDTFEIEWPPHSGRSKQFPEVDRAEWFDLASAYEKINAAQRSLLEQLELICTEPRKS
ncbi:MAG: NUDIX domain-containing protein [Bradyrhizobium sp.]|uniref:NUDIX domain-containing protein n=1 Tax=Bradyrhizobium sp. TaxID=376 RepID=UPI001C29CB30|nr:NUDIX domain-containing protein [Bradyrhizobium sp.]MBU6461371.1 NUDIX domain-containing protein [Pseudomonadota bacterium]MDE2066547.1 NUDIX domain-containing protein [Bradyrhizobium sp.]MDE2472809.1 NUDIX domain-containing protein [Bradyrhizobium sp.]